MWDYNVGLVRMTPFFKACQYSKVRCRRGSVGRPRAFTRRALRLTFANSDPTIQNARHEPWTEGDYAQHHRRLDPRTRYVLVESCMEIWELTTAQQGTGCHIAVRKPCVLHSATRYLVHLYPSSDPTSQASAYLPDLPTSAA